MGGWVRACAGGLLWPSRPARAFGATPSMPVLLSPRPPALQHSMLSERLTPGPSLFHVPHCHLHQARRELLAKCLANDPTKRPSYRTAANGAGIHSLQLCSQPWRWRRWHCPGGEEANTVRTACMHGRCRELSSLAPSWVVALKHMASLCFPVCVYTAEAVCYRRGARAVGRSDPEAVGAPEGQGKNRSYGGFGRAKRYPTVQENVKTNCT